jgi:ribose transport system permease protein
VTAARLRAALGKPYALALVLLVVCVAATALLQPRFLRPALLANSLRSYLPLIFLAVGQTVVVIGGGIDLSLGTLLTLASVVTVRAFGPEPAFPGALAALALGLATGAAAGLANGLCVAYLRLQPIIATFATAFVWGGLALWVLPQPGGTVPEALVEAVRVRWPLPFAVWVILALLATWGWFCGTRGARFLYAVGGHAPAAYASGVAVDRVRLASYLAAGTLAGVGAILLVADLATGDPLIGAPMTLPSVVAVVIGGTRLSGGAGSVVGSVVGVVVLALFRNIVFYLGVPSLWQTLIDGLIVVLALAGPGLVRQVRGAA